MKCVNCGFSCDNEPVCPICGTPVRPVKEPEPPYRARHSAAPVYAQPYEQSYEQPFKQPFEQSYEPPYEQHFEPPVQPFGQPPAPKEPMPPKPSRGKAPNGLRIATLCVLSVIAAALVYIAVIQTIGICRDINRGGHQSSYSSETKPSNEKTEGKTGSPDQIKQPENKSNPAG